MFSIGTLGCISTSSHGFVYFCRFITGLGVGGASFTLPIYGAECSPARLRGALSGFMQMTVVLGLLWAGLMNLAFEKNANGWRWSLGIAVTCPTVLLIGSFFLPESPRWLFQMKGEEVAKKTLQKLRQTDDVSEELDLMKSAIASESGGPVVSIRDVFKEPIKMRTLLAILLQVFQQGSGINVIFVYGGIIFEDLVGNGLVALIILQTVNVFATIPALMYVDDLGRKYLLLRGSVCMAIGLLGGGLASLADMDEIVPKIIVLIFVSFFITAFAMSWGPVAWIVPAEIFPLHVRTYAVCLSAAANWLFGAAAMAANFLIPVLHISGTFFLFSIICLVSGLYVYYNLPETKGVPLEDMEKLFLHRKRSYIELDDDAHL